MAERWVAERLEAAGWEVVARNWRGGGGELDLVAVREGRVRLVEVKARRPGDDAGLEAVGPAKRRRLIQAARLFLDEWPDLVVEACFTVALVHLAGDGPGRSPLRVDWIDDAFDA